MKKIVAICLCGLFVIGLCGCDSDAKRAREAQNHADFMQNAYERAQDNYNNTKDMIDRYQNALDRIS